MLEYVVIGQTGCGLAGTMDQPRTTITYYKLKRDPGYLAIVRYTAYHPDGRPVKIGEYLYQDTPEQFCELEKDIEKALQNGIDASVLSAYEHEVFPVISSYLP
jgi:hypothetical protein